MFVLLRSLLRSLLVDNATPTINFLSTNKNNQTQNMFDKLSSEVLGNILGFCEPLEQYLVRCSCSNVSDAFHVDPNDQTKRVTSLFAKQAIMDNTCCACFEPLTSCAVDRWPDDLAMLENDKILIHTGCARDIRQKEIGFLRDGRMVGHGSDWDGDVGKLLRIDIHYFNVKLAPVLRLDLIHPEQRQGSQEQMTKMIKKYLKRKMHDVIIAKIEMIFGRKHVFQGDKNLLIGDMMKWHKKTFLGARLKDGESVDSYSTRVATIAVKRLKNMEETCLHANTSLSMMVDEAKILLKASGMQNNTEDISLWNLTDYTMGLIGVTPESFLDQNVLKHGVARFTPFGSTDEFDIRLMRFRSYTYSRIINLRLGLYREFWFDISNVQLKKKGMKSREEVYETIRSLANIYEEIEPVLSAICEECLGMSNPTIRKESRITKLLINRILQFGLHFNEEDIAEIRGLPEPKTFYDTLLGLKSFHNELQRCLCSFCQEMKLPDLSCGCHRRMTKRQRIDK